jgi:hypothetical protein
MSSTPTRDAPRGQAAVEAALTLPLFVFIVLGTLQLNLMNQARLLTKYAAYKAARTGSLRSANLDMMEQAAVAVLLPMISHPQGAGQQLVYKTKDAVEYAAAIQRQPLADNRMPDCELKFAQVVICGPTRAMVRTGVRTADSDLEEYDFDDPRNAASVDWEQFERTKLFVQVTFNYRMGIPFANALLYLIARGQERAELMSVVGMTGEQTRHFLRDERRDVYDALAKDKHIYVLPIRAQWGMRMQSNLYPDSPGYELPAESRCYVPFPKKGESDPGGPGAGSGSAGDNPDDEEEPL